MSGRLVSIVLASALVVGMPVASVARPAGREGRAAEMQIRPTSGPAGTQIGVRARGVPTTACARWLYFVDSGGAETFLEVRCRL